MLLRFGKRFVFDSEMLKSKAQAGSRGWVVAADGLSWRGLSRGRRYVLAPFSYGLHNLYYATLRGETPPFGVAFAPLKTTLTAIPKQSENPLRFSGEAKV